MHILSIIDKGTLAQLSRPSDRIATRHLLFRVLGEALLFSAAVMLLADWPVPALLCFYACAIWHGFWGYAGIGHELYHSRVFSNLKLNKLLYRIASYLTWNNPGFFRKSHNYHHHHTFAADDGEAQSTQDWRPLAVFLYLTVDLPVLLRRLYYVLINAAGLTPKEGGFTRIDGACQREAILMLAFNIAVQLALWAAFEAWHINLMWFLLPFTGQFLNRLLAQSQHVGLAGAAQEGPLKHSRTLPLPALLEFLYAGMNFHAEHHLAPVIPYYNLPRLNALLLERKLLSRIDASSFFMKDIWAALKTRPES